MVFMIMLADKLQILTELLLPQKLIYMEIILLECILIAERLKIMELLMLA